MTELEQLRMQLKFLSLHHMAEIFEEEAHKATKAKMAYTSYLARLVEEQILVKTDRSVQSKIRKARFPSLKTLESFNFSFQPSLDERKIKELAQLGFITKQENIVFVGPPLCGAPHNGGYVESSFMLSKSLNPLPFAFFFSNLST